MKIATAQMKEVGRPLKWTQAHRDCYIVSVFMLCSINTRSVLSDWTRDRVARLAWFSQITSHQISWLASCLVSCCNPSNGLIACHESQLTIGSVLYVWWMWHISPCAMPRMDAIWPSFTCPEAKMTRFYVQKHSLPPYAWRFSFTFQLCCSFLILFRCLSIGCYLRNLEQV